MAVTVTIKIQDKKPVPDCIVCAQHWSHLRTLYQMHYDCPGDQVAIIIYEAAQDDYLEHYPTHQTEVLANAH